MLPNRQVSDTILVDVQEAARLLSVSPRTLWSLTASGELPAVRLGRSVRYDRDDLVAFVAARKTRTAAVLPMRPAGEGGGA